MDKKVNIRKYDHVDLEVLVKLRLEFLKEAWHVKDDEDVSDLYIEIHEYITI